MTADGKEPFLDGDRGEVVPWRPILDGALAKRAKTVVDELAATLAAASPQTVDPSYAGRAGIALFLGYRAAVFDDEAAHEAVAHQLERACEEVDEETPWSFFDGLSGLAWSGQHLDRLLSGESDPDATADVDEGLMRLLATRPWPGHLDLVYGLTGLGCYAVDHPNRSRARQLFDLVIERLDELTPTDHRGHRTWRTPPRLAPPDLASRYPDGFFNLGVAHGVAGTIGMLAQACALDDLVDERPRELLQGAVRWLLTHRRPADGGSIFTTYLAGADDRGASARSAWCYGDPGVAAVLLGAARVLGQDELKEEALAIAHHAALRPPEESGVIDACLCHGAAGLGHLFNRLYQATGAEPLAGAARYWLQRTLDLRRPGEGVGGYASWWPREKAWKAAPGLLDGTAGVGLALLAAISEQESNWDRPLLCALPPRRAFEL